MMVVLSPFLGIGTVAFVVSFDVAIGAIDGIGTRIGSRHRRGRLYHLPPPSVSFFATAAAAMGLLLSGCPHCPAHGCYSCCSRYGESN